MPQRLTEISLAASRISSGVKAQKEPAALRPSSFAALTFKETALRAVSSAADLLQYPPVKCCEYAQNHTKSELQVVQK